MHKDETNTHDQPQPEAVRDNAASGPVRFYLLARIVVVSLGLASHVNYVRLFVIYKTIHKNGRSHFGRPNSTRVRTPCFCV